MPSFFVISIVLHYAYMSLVSYTEQLSVSHSIVTESQWLLSHWLSSIDVSALYWHLSWNEWHISRSFEDKTLRLLLKFVRCAGLRPCFFFFFFSRFSLSRRPWTLFCLFFYFRKKIPPLRRRHSVSLITTPEGGSLYFIPRTMMEEYSTRRKAICAFSLVNWLPVRSCLSVHTFCCSVATKIQTFLC